MAYTGAEILVRAVMSASSGLPEDVVVNDFAFKKASGTATTTDIDNAFTLVSNFYRTAQVAGPAVGDFISNAVDRGVTHELQGWFINTPPMGSPDLTEAWLGPVSAFDGTGLPREVAAVLSFHADLTGILEESGTQRPRARRRGRLYIGPLTITNSILGTAAPYLLDPTLNTVLRQAAIVLKDDSAAAGIPWGVWSRQDQTVRPVVAGWTDNAPDTQRRRGPAATTRVVWGP